MQSKVILRCSQAMQSRVILGCSQAVKANKNLDPSPQMYQVFELMNPFFAKEVHVFGVTPHPLVIH